jgi:hypothetical protein
MFPQRLEQLKQSGYSEEVNRVLVPDGVPLLVDGTGGQIPLLANVTVGQTPPLLADAAAGVRTTVTFREHSGNIQGIFNIRGTFREHSGNIQGTFREYSTFGEHSGNI